MNTLTRKTPREIERTISECIIGQPEGVRAIATALSAHISRIIYNREHPKNGIKKDLLLLCGPSGCGKTESIKTVIKAMNLPIPCVVVSSTNLSTAGYKGKNVESILSSDLIPAAKHIINAHVFDYINTIDYRDTAKRMAILNNASVRLAETGIVIFDEFDKLAANSRNENTDSWNMSLQNSLLKMIEGGCGFGDDELAMQIDTTDILFIFAGAFTKLLKPETDYSMGFQGYDPITPPEIKIPSTEDLIDFGFSREICGRITQKTRFYDLDEDAMYRILVESKISPVNDFKHLFEQTGNHLLFDEEALRVIAKKAATLGIGARGLRTVLGKRMYEILFDIDGIAKDDDIKITERVFTENANPIIEKHVHKETQVKQR